MRAGERKQCELAIEHKWIRWLKCLCKDKIQLETDTQTNNGQKEKKRDQTLFEGAYFCIVYVI